MIRMNTTDRARRMKGAAKANADERTQAIAYYSRAGRLHREATDTTMHRLAGGSGFFTAGSTAATAGSPRIGSLVVLTGNVESRAGESGNAGERWHICGGKRGAWHLKQGERRLRNVSDFQIRLA